jgi:hypothetical protein
MFPAQGDQAKVTTNLESAAKSAERLTTSIDELLLLAGVRKASVSSGTIDMNVPLGEALENCESVFLQHGATVAALPALPPAVAHGPWISHVWSNFLSNAAKYGGPAAQISIGFRVTGSRIVGMASRLTCKLRSSCPFLESAAIASKATASGSRSYSASLAGSGGMSVSRARRDREHCSGSNCLLGR